MTGILKFIPETKAKPPPEPPNDVACIYCGAAIGVPCRCWLAREGFV